MENTDVNFVGNGKKIGNKIQLVMRWEDLQKIPRWTSKSGAEYLTVNLIPRKQVSKWGHSHVIAEYQPLKKQEN